jgi:hypothetical protein
LTAGATGPLPRSTRRKHHRKGVRSGDLARDCDSEVDDEAE